MKATTRFIGAAALPLLGWMWLMTTEAPAQCSFDASVPSENDVLDAVPLPMTINFALGIELQNVRLVGADGTEWPTDWVGTKDDVYKAEFRPTKPLPPGKYQIEWIAYVRQHYHPDGGVIVFTIAAPGSAETSARATPAATPPAGGALRAASGLPYRGLPEASSPQPGR